MLCEVETDKSTVGFEVQEDFFLGKILKPAGSSGIRVNELVAVAVYKKEDVSAVKDYVDESAAVSPIAADKAPPVATKEVASKEDASSAKIEAH